MTKENKFKIGLCLQEIALSMDDATLERNRERLKLIEDIIAGEQEQKTGQWIEHFDESGKWCECDQCHTDWGGSVNYCPNCGAEMR